MAILPLASIETPAYVLDAVALARNLAVAARIKRETGCNIILALKGFAQWSAFPLMRGTLDGTAASGIHEALLGHEKFGGEVHVYSPAYDDAEIAVLIPISHHIVFNSPSQFARYYPRIKKAGGKVSCGIRINPELAQAKTVLYDPCAPCSRLGTRKESLFSAATEGLEGLHVHALCENMAEASVRLIQTVDREFGGFIRERGIKWVNFGGGHYITHAGYDVNALIVALKNFTEKYGVKVILEPGGALAYDAGFLVASVLDIMENGKPIALLDTSATTHMPDVLEMPYRPNILGAGAAGEKPFTYLLGGRTCLAGDVLGEYSFDAPLQVGDKLVFTDMAQYSMVKNTTFNGMPLPDIGILHPDGKYERVRRFGYEDFKTRLS